MITKFEFINIIMQTRQNILNRSVSTGNLLPDITERVRKIHTLRELFIVQLQYMYHDEILLCQWFPRFQANSLEEELLNCLREYDLVIQAHVQKLQSVFNYLGVHSGERKNAFLPKLLVQYKKNGTNLQPPLKDLWIIQVLEQTGYYKIACYKALICLARRMDKKRAASILQRIFDEECEALTKLNSGLLDVLKKI